jgi:hypothetical protein
MAKPFFVLFVANAIIDKDAPVTIHYQQAAHGPVAQVVLVAGIHFVPEHFWHNAKHGAAVEFEVAGFDGNKFHAVLNFAKIKFLALV